MATTSAEECLEQLLPQRASASTISSLILGIDHVGFMAAPEDEGALDSAASEAGFGSNGHTFPSTILTRQLAQLAGRTVPTTIFEALAADPDRGTLRVEVAIPRGIERNFLEGLDSPGNRRAPGVRGEPPSAVRRAGRAGGGSRIPIAGLAAGAPVHQSRLGGHRPVLRSPSRRATGPRVLPLRLAMSRLSELGGSDFRFCAGRWCACCWAGGASKTEWQVGDGRELALARYVEAEARRGDLDDVIRVDR